MSQTEPQHPPMQSEPRAFLDLCIRHDVLRFGEFTLKSGRESPYFFNTGAFNNGHLLAQLARGYAELITRHIAHPYMLYGPAYKGIPLVTATAIQLAAAGHVVAYAFNRKEAKPHGEGGTVIGAPLGGEVVVVDDVITAGTSIREAAAVINDAGARICAVVIALDRQEVARGESQSAVEKIQDGYGIPVYPLVTLDSLLAYLKSPRQSPRQSPPTFYAPLSGRNGAAKHEIHDTIHDSVHDSVRDEKNSMPPRPDIDDPDDPDALPRADFSSHYAVIARHREKWRARRDSNSRPHGS